MGEEEAKGSESGRGIPCKHLFIVISAKFPPLRVLLSTYLGVERAKRVERSCREGQKKTLISRMIFKK